MTVWSVTAILLAIATLEACGVLALRLAPTSETECLHAR